MTRIPRIFKLLLIALLSVVYNTGISQVPTRDSLQQVYNSSSDDSVRIELLIQLSETDHIETNEADSFASQAMKKAEGLGDPLLIAKSISSKGHVLFDSNAYDSSLTYYIQALRLSEKHNFSIEISKNLMMIASCFEEQMHFDSARVYYLSAIALADSVKYNKGSANYRLYLGELESRMGANDKALVYFKVAYEFYKSGNDKEKLTSSMNNIAIVYHEMGLYASSLEYYLMATDIVEEMNDNIGKISLYNNLALIYQELGRLDKSNEFFVKGLEVSKKHGTDVDISLLLTNHARLHNENQDTLRAWEALKKAHQINLRIGGDCDLPYTYEGLAEVMVWKKNYDSAEFYYKEGLKYAQTCEDIGSEGSIRRNLGILYSLQRKYAASEKQLLAAYKIGLKVNYLSEVKESAKELFNFYYKRNDTEKALKYQIIYSNMKDSLFNTESAERIAQLSSEHEFKENKQYIEYEKKAEEMRLGERNREKEIYQNSILVVLVLTVLLAATLARSYFLLQNHNKKLQVINEEKNTLMGVVAHDLRSPLNNIKGLMSLVKMENSNLSPEQRHYFHLVDDTMDRMRDMIDRVLDVSAIEDMKVSLQLKEVDLGSVSNFVIGNFEPLAEKKNIKIMHDINEDAYHVLADYNYLIQIIENLLSNAIKFSEQGKKIFVSISNHDDFQTIVVKDEGPGISDVDQKKLFTKFQKLSAQPTDNEQSTGLGLSIVKKFVDAMGAEILCESELGEGTSFLVKFKAFRAVQEA